jgi:hypothetical protein
MRALGELLKGSQKARELYRELHNATEVYTIHYVKVMLPETNVDTGQVFMDPESLRCYQFKGRDGMSYDISGMRALGHELAHLVIHRQVGLRGKLPFFRDWSELGAILNDNKIAGELGEPGVRIDHDIYKKGDGTCQ